MFCIEILHKPHVFVSCKICFKQAIRSESTPHQIEAKNLCFQAFELMAKSDAGAENQQEDIVQLQNASNLLDEKLLQTQV